MCGFHAVGKKCKKNERGWESWFRKFRMIFNRRIIPVCRCTRGKKVESAHSCCILSSHRKQHTHFHHNGVTSCYTFLCNCATPFAYPISCVGYMEHGKCVNVCIGIGIIIINNESSVWFGRPYELGRNKKEKRGPTHSPAVTSIDKFSLKMMHVFIYAINLFVRLWHKHGRNEWILIHIDRMSAKYQNATAMPIECALRMMGRDGLLYMFLYQQLYRSQQWFKCSKCIRFAQSIASNQMTTHSYGVAALGFFFLLLLFAFDWGNIWCDCLTS